MWKDWSVEWIIYQEAGFKSENANCTAERVNSLNLVGVFSNAPICIIHLHEGELRRPGSKVRHTSKNDKLKPESR